MSIAEIHPRAFYSLRTTIKNNAHYITDAEILYPAGGLLILHNYTEKQQRYIQLLDKSIYLLLIIVSPNKTLAATIENSERPQINLYDLKTLKKKQTLHLPPDANAKRFESISFSHDEKFVVAVSGEPDWMMYCYNWEKGKVETSTKANYPNNPTPVSEVVCSPSDSAVVLLYGPGLFRLMNMQETVWRQYGFQKADQMVITAAAFLTNDRVLAGTQDGKLLLVDNGELKAIFDALAVTFINAKEKEETGSVTSLAGHVPDDGSEEDRTVTVLIALNKGFAYACRPGFVHLFEKESTHRFRKRNLFRIAEIDYREAQDDVLNVVKHMSVNVSQDKLLATTNKSQIYSVRLWGPDIILAPEIPFKHLGVSIHHGPITGLAVCSWKPIFVTCGFIDRSVRVWDYETGTVSLVKQYQEDIYSVALHPTGLFATIGFADKLRFMIVLIDDIQPCREFPIRECLLVAFSSNGHFFAAVNYNVIQIYSVISFQNVYNLKGHNGVVKGLVWTPDDKKLVSCGDEGAVYEWDMTVGKRVGEVVTKLVAYSDVAITSDGKFIYAVGNDGELKEILDSSIIRAFNMKQSIIDHIVLSRSDQMLFLAGDNGNIMSLKMPMADPPEYRDFYYHSSRIKKMVLCYNDLTLITVSEGGSLCIWKLTQCEEKIITMDKDYAYSEEILISQRDLEDKIMSISELTRRMYELEMEHAYQMRQTETTNEEKITKIHDTYCQAIEELKEKNELLDTEHNKELQNINSDVNKLIEKHDAATRTMETAYNLKLIEEYDKLTALEESKNEMQEQYETQLQVLQTAKDEALSELTSEYEAKILNLNKQLEESFGDNTKEQKEHEEIKQQIEEDADREIVELTTKYEALLKDERDLNAKLKGETGVMKKKFMTSQREIEDFRLQVHQLLGEHQKFQAVIQNLERDIIDLKREINERDATIQDKEKRIYELKRKNQELEKFKFVLNYKIKELNNQIEPRDKEIKERKDQIAEMKEVLEDLQKIKINLELDVKAREDKIQSVEHDMRQYKEKHKCVSAVLRNIKTDITVLSGYLQDFKKLKDGVKTMFQKYAQDQNFLRRLKIEEDIQAEFMRQREHLHQTINTLQKTINKSRETQSTDSMKVIEENCVLIEEINKLRKELKIARQQVHEFETLLCLKAGTKSTPKEAFAKLQQALKSQDDIRAEYQLKLDEAEIKIDLLKEEINRLLYKGNVDESDAAEIGTEDGSRYYD